jgi:hypothetical protein
MFDNTTFSLASAVADNGTVTVGYPTDRSQGDYDWTPGKHVLFVAGNQYNAPADFTLTFNANASDITLTNKSGVAWPAQSACRLQIDRPGAEDKRIDNTAEGNDRVRQIPTQLALISLGSPDADDPNGYCESQDLTDEGVFSDDTTAAAAIAAAALVGEADVPRNVVATWTGTAVLTVTGTDEFGDTIVESSGSGTTLASKKAFKTVTGISTSADITALTVGTGEVLGLPVKVGKLGQILGEFKDGVPLAKFTDNSTGTAGSTIAAGVGVSTVAIPIQLDTISDADVLTTYTPGYKFKILAVDFAVADPATTGSKATTLNLEIGTTNVTGGTVALTSDNATPLGAVVAGAAVTALNTGSASATISIEASSTTAFVEGTGYLLLTIQNMDTADAIASIIDALNDRVPLAGTFVAGVGTEATATTGDVRGTYDPADDADGDEGYMLLVALTNPADKGVAQYGG